MGRGKDFWQGKARGGFGPLDWTFGDAAPRIDVAEYAERIRITVELPGVSAKDIDLTLDDDALIISGEKKPSKKDRKRRAVVAERAYGAFRRTVPLGAAVDENDVNATFADGVLTVTLRKLRPTTQRRIDVRSP